MNGQLDGETDGAIHAPPIPPATRYPHPSSHGTFPQKQHSNHAPRRAYNHIAPIPVPVSAAPTPALAPGPPRLSRQRPHANKSAVQHLLPYCTTEPPLTDAQVIALSDVVASLEELLVLALGAASGDGSRAARLEAAVGRRVAAGIVEFFVDEWEMEG